MWFHGIGALPLRPDSRSGGKSGGQTPRPDTQLARLADPTPHIPEMITGGSSNNHQNAEIEPQETTDLLFFKNKKRNNQAGIKTNGTIFHLSDPNCIPKPPIGVHRSGAFRSYPIPVSPPVVPDFIPRPPQRTTSDSSLPGSKRLSTFSAPEPKPEPTFTNPSETAQKTEESPTSTVTSDCKQKSPVESPAESAQFYQSFPKRLSLTPLEAKTVTTPTAEERKGRDTPTRNLISPSPKSSQLSLHLSTFADSRRSPSPAPPIPPLPTNKTSLHTLVPPEEKENRRVPSPIQRSPSPRPPQYTLSIPKSPQKEGTGRKSPLSEFLAKNILRKSSSRTSIPELHEATPSPSKQSTKKECHCELRKPPSTPIRPKSVAFAIDNEASSIPPPPPPPRATTKPVNTPPVISKASSCPGIIYSPRKDILIVKQPLAIIKPTPSPVQTIGFKSTPGGQIFITGSRDIEAEIVNVVTAGGEILSVLCEKQQQQGGGSDICGGCVKSGGGNFCIIEGRSGASGGDYNSALAGRRASNASLASLVVGGCCGTSEFGGLLIGEDIVVMGASGGAGAGAKGASGGSEAESCGGGACRKILSGRHHHQQQQQQQQTASKSQPQQQQQQQFQQPKGGGGPGPGPGGGGTQVRGDCHCALVDSEGS